MKRICLLLLLPLASLAAAGPKVAKSPIEQAEAVHGLKAWWKQQAVEATLTLDYKGKRVLDAAEFYFEAHGPRAWCRLGDTQVVFDGKTAWAWGPDQENAMNRFQVRTWPWFVMAPFKMQGAGTQLGPLEERPLLGETYQTFLQTFDADQGDSPEDWYRLYIHPRTHRLDAMGYIVTYFQERSQAEQQQAIILYEGYEVVDGALLSKRYRIWASNAAGELVGDKPKAIGRFEQLRLHEEVDANRFHVPTQAVEIKLPKPAR